jgi:hypothetical protein
MLPHTQQINKQNKTKKSKGEKTTASKRLLKSNHQIISFVSSTNRILTFQNCKAKWSGFSRTLHQNSSKDFIKSNLMKKKKQQQQRRPICSIQNSSLSLSLSLFYPSSEDREGGFPIEQF